MPDKESRRHASEHFQSYSSNSLCGQVVGRFDATANHLDNLIWSKPVPQVQDV